MPLKYTFWIIVLLWAIFIALNLLGTVHWPAGSVLFPFTLIGVLGWQVFGSFVER